ncbi:MAG TPA: UDP-N-acetylmuramate--L-alanine ligase, partial [Candidatus Aminicenantes bacterium]|nr:UDP-N-acetylmuramate--L-alanine ligase [Candidatus Aminicenantes bacterium]
RRLVVVFQPHRYSRLSRLIKEFATSFNQADVLVITEIYAAGEEPISGVNGQALYEEIKKFGHKNVIFEPELSRLPDLLKSLLIPNDMLLVLGAGNVNRIIPELIKRLEGEK